MITTLLFWFFGAHKEPPVIEVLSMDAPVQQDGLRDVGNRVMTEEEIARSRQAGRAQLARLHQLMDAVYQEDYRAAPALFEEVIRVKSINADPNEPLQAALMRLSNLGIAAMGDLYLDTGNYDGALKVAEILAKKFHDTDSLLLAEIIALRASSPPPQGSGFGEAYLSSYFYQFSSDIEAYFDQNDGLRHDLSLLYTARGLTARHHSALDRAMHHFRRALEYDPDNVFAQLHHSGALLDSGSTEAGKQILRSLVDSEFRQVAKEARRILIRVGG